MVLTRIMRGSSAAVLADLLHVLLPDARTVLDATYGSGRFWDGSTGLAVIGMDLNPDRAPHVRGDFTRLPFRDGSVDAVIFDPPYVTDAGVRSIMRARFGAFEGVAELRAAVEAGTREAWRVARIGIVVKVQTYVHASRLVRMPRWVEDAIAPADLFDEVYLESPTKAEDGKWARKGEQLSVRSNATTFLVFRKDGAVHKRRRAG